MKTGEDFRREFPEVEEGFRSAAQKALRCLHEPKENERMKLRPMLIIAAVLMLLMGVGVAATWERWSLDDFIPTGRITATEEEWRAMIASFEPVTVTCEVADVTVREALFDGYALYIVIDIAPRLAGDFFVPSLTTMDSPAREAASSLYEQQTVREYMGQNGFDRAFGVSIHTNMPGMSFWPEMEVNEDGTMTFFQRQRMQHDGIQVDVLNTTIHLNIKNIDGSGSFQVQIPLTMQRLPVVEEAFGPTGNPHEFENTGVAVMNLRLMRTPLSTYLTADVEVINDEAYRSSFGNYVFRFFSADGQEYDAGPFNVAGFVMESDAPNKEKGDLYYMSTMTMTELPDSLMIIEAPWGVHDPAEATDVWTIRLENAE